MSEFRYFYWAAWWKFKPGESFRSRPLSCSVKSVCLLSFFLVFPHEKVNYSMLYCTNQFKLWNLRFHVNVWCEVFRCRKTGPSECLCGVLWNWNTQTLCVPQPEQCLSVFTLQIYNLLPNVTCSSNCICVCKKWICKVNINISKWTWCPFFFFCFHTVGKTTRALLLMCFIGYDSYM